MTAPTALRNINGDHTIEETQNADYPKDDEADEQMAKGGESGRIAAMVIIALVMVRGGWMVRKVRSDKAA